MTRIQTQTEEVFDCSEGRGRGGGGGGRRRRGGGGRGDEGIEEQQRRTSSSTTQYIDFLSIISIAPTKNIMMMMLKCSKYFILLPYCFNHYSPPPPLPPLPLPLPLPPPPPLVLQQIGSKVKEEEGE